MYTLWIEQYESSVRFITSDLDHAIHIAESIEKMHSQCVSHIKIYNETNMLVYWIELFAHAATVYHITST